MHSPLLRGGGIFAPAESKILNPPLNPGNFMHPLIAIVGPTASGKSDLALFLAKSLSGEIVNYDSVQIFRHLDIGTAKPTREQRSSIPHHMIDIREPTEVYTAGDYQRDARRVLYEIRDRGKLPILVGG